MNYSNRYKAKKAEIAGIVFDSQKEWEEYKQSAVRNN